MPASPISILKEWSARGQGEDLRSLFVGLNEKLSAIPEARMLVVPPPPIQGIGNAAGFAMQIELRDGNADFGKLQAITNAMVASGQTQSALQRVSVPVPLHGAAIRRRDRPGQDPDPACHHRPDVLDAVVLYGRLLRQPVQQVRPHVPGLHPGRRAVPPDAARHREPDGAQLERRHDPDRHGGEDHAGGRAVADQPVQSLSVLDHHRPAGAQATAPASRWS